MNVSELNQVIPKLKLDVLRIISKAGYGSTGSALSCLDLISCLYFGEINGRRVMKYDPLKPQWDERDYFILSKWQAAPTLYACLAKAGFFSRDELDYFARPGALLQGHPIIKIPGVEQTIGSFGYGLSIANGLALGLKFDKKLNHVFVLIDSAELQSGQIWEAAMTSSHYHLDTITLLIDHSRLQTSGEIRGVKNIEPLVDKFEACGWKVFRLLDGHNPAHILNAIADCFEVVRKPTVIVCSTVSGRGISFIENKPYYYQTALSEQEYEVARRELEVKE